MTYYRYAADDNGTIVKGDYDSDGNWIGKGPDPRLPRFVTNITHTPVMEELVNLASKHTGLPFSYRLGGQTYQEMDWCDAAEAYDNGYQPDPDKGAIFTTANPDIDKSPFWDELERLHGVIKTPLDEPILDDDYPVHQGLLYVANGKVTVFIDWMNMTVGRWKALRIRGVDPVTEVRRCDITGRIARRKPKDKPQSAMEMELKNSAYRHSGHHRRRRRSSNKIKKVG